MEGLLLESKKVVAYSDIQKIFDERIGRLGNVTGDEMKLEINQMMTMIYSKSFDLDHEVPLNKRFLYNWQR